MLEIKEASLPDISISPLNLAPRILQLKSFLETGWLFTCLLPHDYNTNVREVTGQIFRLKHHPFPFREKDKKEYIIGEALLRWKGIPEDELATLRNVAFDPPDLVFETEDFGKIRLEITESVPYDRDSEAKSAYFIRSLKTHLKRLGTRPPKPSNIFVSRETFDFPSIRSREIQSIARQIDRFSKNKNFEAKYEIIQEIVASPLRIAFIPALGTFAHPPEYYADNLFIYDTTGYSLDYEDIVHSFEAIIESKKYSETAAYILIIFHGTIGLVSLDDGLLDQLKNRLTAAFTYDGIYIVEIIQLPSDYWVHVITVREHPSFERKSVQR